MYHHDLSPSTLVINLRVAILSYANHFFFLGPQKFGKDLEVVKWPFSGILGVFGHMQIGSSFKALY